VYIQDGGDSDFDSLATRSNMIITKHNVLVGGGCAPGEGGDSVTNPIS
jgi:hypothetical protein